MQGDDLYNKTQVDYRIFFQCSKGRGMDCFSFISAVAINKGILLSMERAPKTTTVPVVLNEVFPGATNAKEAKQAPNKTHAVVFCALLFFGENLRGLLVLLSLD